MIARSITLHPLLLKCPGNLSIKSGRVPKPSNSGQHLLPQQAAHLLPPSLSLYGSEHTHHFCQRCNQLSNCLSLQVIAATNIGNCDELPWCMFAVTCEFILRITLCCLLTGVIRCLLTRDSILRCTIRFKAWIVRVRLSQSPAPGMGGFQRHLQHHLQQLYVSWPRAERDSAK